MREEHERVRARRAERPARDDHARVDNVRDVEHARDQSSCYEAELHGDRQPGAARARQMPLLPELRDYGRSREPRRHREDDRRREQNERATCAGLGQVCSICSVHTSAVPSRTTTPSWFTIVVRSVVIGLSSRTATTSTSAVISSPGETGARKLQSTCRNTLPGPGRSSATTALSSPVVTPPCTISRPNRDRAAASSS